MYARSAHRVDFAKISTTIIYMITDGSIACKTSYIFVLSAKGQLSLSIPGVPLWDCSLLPFATISVERNLKSL